MTEKPYSIGQMLKIDPKDDDDPLALKHEGALCRMVRYRPYAAGGFFAEVEVIEAGRSLPFRLADLEAAQ